MADNDSEGAPAAAGAADQDPEPEPEPATATVEDIVPFEGPTSTIGEAVASSNNFGLGFTTAYVGRSSIGIISKERGKPNSARSITVLNQGAATAVHAHSKPTKLTMDESNYIFPGGTGLYEFASKGIPELRFELASLVVLSGAFTGAGLSRGSVYESSSQESKPLYGPVPDITLVVVHGILSESNSTNFFGGNRLVCTLVNTDPKSVVVPSGNTSEVVVLNMRCVRDKVPLSDDDARKPLKVDLDQLRDIHHSSEAKFVTWYNMGSPVITTANLRDVTRMTDAFGKPFFDDYDVPPVDLTAADEKTRKKESTKSIPKDKGKKVSGGQRNRASGSAAKGPRSSAGPKVNIDNEDYSCLGDDDDDANYFPAPIPMSSKYRSQLSQFGHNQSFDAPLITSKMISPGSVQVRERAAAAEATNVEKDKQLEMVKAFAAESAESSRASVAYHQQQFQRQHEASEATFQRQNNERYRELMLTAFKAHDAPTAQQAQMFSHLGAMGAGLGASSSSSFGFPNHNSMAVPQQQQHQMQQHQQQMQHEHQDHFAAGGGGGALPAIAGLYVSRLISHMQTPMIELFCSQIPGDGEDAEEAEAKEVAKKLRVLKRTFDMLCGTDEPMSTEENKAARMKIINGE